MLSSLTVNSVFRLPNETHLTENRLIQNNPLCRPFSAIMRIRADTTISGLADTDGMVHRKTIFKIDLKNTRDREPSCNRSGRAGSAAYLRLEEAEWQGRVSVFGVMRGKHQPQRPSRSSCIKIDRIFFVVMGTLPASFEGLVKPVNSIEVSEVFKAKQ